ncbi:MAG: hypothetical protein IKE30_05630 [Clostridia bacterium]|nr:hypothetical protein [Clostridia bacterium]
MKYSVVLQAPMDFSRVWIPLGICLMLAPGAIWLAVRLLQTVRKRRRVPSADLLRAARLRMRKKRHTKNIDRIEAALKSGSIDVREAHQRTAREVRVFAEAVTGVPITRMVLSEIQKARYPWLAEHIKELYAPEFGRQPDTEIGDLIQNSKELIETWQ